jgi:hypothetical protein
MPKTNRDDDQAIENIENFIKDAVSEIGALVEESPELERIVEEILGKIQPRNSKPN